MPFWASFLIRMVLKFGVPWLEAHVSPAVAAIIEKILGIFKASPNQAQTCTELGCLLDSYKPSGVATSPGLK